MQISRAITLRLTENFYHHLVASSIALGRKQLNRDTNSENSPSFAVTQLNCYDRRMLFLT